MPLDVLRTTAVRWAAAIAACFTLSALALFGFVYWQTAGYETREIDSAVSAAARLIADAGTSAERNSRLESWLAEDRHSVRYGLLTDVGGLKQAGNMESLPAGATVDGQPRLMRTSGLDQDDDEGRDEIRGATIRLADGGQLTLGLDTDELDHMRGVILRALGLGLIPMTALALGGGAILGRRAVRRISAVDAALVRVRNGEIGERLPLRGTGDEFDRMARAVNLMLDDIEHLIGELRGLGDSIAHDLRTPLMRMRARLESSRDQVGSPEQFKEAIDEALGWLDQTLSIITAVLRIGEVEHGARRAGFTRFDLAAMLREAFELYEPLAEDKGMQFTLDLALADPDLHGDRELMLEAVVNLLDNAIKFAPPGGRCVLRAQTKVDELAISVVDNGPGIPRGERDAVLKRFYRGERSRSSEGSGLGLALVSAVARLHDFDLTIADNDPGTRVCLHRRWQ